MRQHPADILPLVPGVHEHVQILGHPKLGHIRRRIAKVGKQRVLPVLVREGEVGAEDGVAAVDLGVGQPEDLLAGDGPRTVGGHHHIGDVGLAAERDDARFEDALGAADVVVLDHAVAKRKLDADLLGVVEYDLVQLPAVAGVLPPEVVRLQDPVLLPDDSPVGLAGLEPVTLVDAQPHEVPADPAILPALDDAAPVGEEVDDVAVRLACRVCFDDGHVHAAFAALDGRRQSAETGPDDQDVEFLARRHGGYRRMR